MPPQVDLSTKQLTLIIILTGALAGVIGGLVDSAIPDPGIKPVDAQSEEPSDPDERPPVIINNGSIKFEPQDKTGDWEGSAKTFCSVCGSNLFGGGWPESEQSSVRLSAIDSPFQQRPEAHHFVRSLAPWETLPEDGLPRYEIRSS